MDFRALPVRNIYRISRDSSPHELRRGRFPSPFGWESFISVGASFPLESLDDPFTASIFQFTQTSSFLLHMSGVSFFADNTTESRTACQAQSETFSSHSLAPKVKIKTDVSDEVRCGNCTSLRNAAERDMKDHVNTWWCQPAFAPSSQR